MKIDNVDEENMGKRFVQKEFKCQSCFRIFKKLVQIYINNIQCPFCNSDNCNLINKSSENNINNNFELDNSSLKTQVTLKEEDEDKKMQINNDNNLNNDKNNFKFLNKKKLLESVQPFSVSPFANSVHRHNFDISDILEDGILTTVTEDFFLDNFASNFISNFDNPFGRMIFIQMQIENNSKIKSEQPLTPIELRQIQKFEMSKNYCKLNINDKNDYELPNCIFCLKDILLETNCFLLRCGHLLHDKCFYNWVKEHKICPVCKFSIVRKGFVRKSSIDIIIDETIKQEEQIGKSISNNIDNNNKNMKNQLENNSIDIVKLIDNENSNINIIGEKKDEMELFFEDV
jgi:hypothetical protein